MHNIEKKLILASASPARTTLLKGAGLKFTTCPADIDEEKIKNEFLSAPDQPVQNLAQSLAEQKALHISRLEPSSYIIGADQLLVHDSEVLNKPATKAQAQAQLQKLRGQTHLLISAVSLVIGNKIIWTYSEIAQMTMRSFSDNFLEAYLQTAGDSIYGCVGGYQLEGSGAQLFSSVKGDYFTVLGLPLLALLENLRIQKVLAS